MRDEEQPAPMIPLPRGEVHVWTRRSAPGSEELGARDYVRQVLSRHLDGPPEGWRFREGARGRPELDLPPGSPPVAFSVSHTSGLLAVAVSASDATLGLGVDVERVVRGRPVEAIAEDFFAPAEIAWLSEWSPALRLPAFYELWTIKEAYIKARGLGFAIPLHTFCVSVDPRSSGATLLVAPPGDEDPASWRIERFLAAPEVHGAVVVRAPCPIELVLHEETPTN